MSDVIFVADFFKEDILGGAEINDGVFIDFLKDNNLLHEKKHTHKIGIEYVLNNVDKTWIIANFTGLRQEIIAAITKNCNYYLYEHDYKFLASRNPIFYPEFKAPKKDIININFYRNAKKVICLSKLQQDIFLKNMDLENTININCSLFSDEQLGLFKKINKIPKSKRNAIINSSNPTKKRFETEKYCKENNIEYDLISHEDNEEFLKIMAQYEKLYFMTAHPEPTPRVAVEAKALNCKFVAPKHLIGVSYEYWFDLNGDELIEEIRNIREKAFSLFMEFFA